MANGKTVLVFPRRKIQFVGRISKEEAIEMHNEVSKTLSNLFDEEIISITHPKLNTMTVTWTFPRTFNFLNIPCNASFSYEPELFPAAILSKWQPIKVVLFPSGHVNFTGVRETRTVIPIIEEINKEFF